jgi:hypothetical protein
MKITIIRGDGTVYVDGVPRTVDCSSLPADLHAVQWDGTAGEIEYASVRCAGCGGVSRKANQPITDMTPYQPQVDAWHAAGKGVAGAS